MQGPYSRVISIICGGLAHPPIPLLHWSSCHRVGPASPALEIVRTDVGSQFDREARDGRRCGTRSQANCRSAARSSRGGSRDRARARASHATCATRRGGTRCRHAADRRQVPSPACAQRADVVAQQGDQATAPGPAPWPRAAADACTSPRRFGAAPDSIATRRSAATKPATLSNRDHLTRLAVV
jgi:hypothetical protein